MDPAWLQASYIAVLALGRWWWGGWLVSGLTYRLTGYRLCTALKCIVYDSSRALRAGAMGLCMAAFQVKLSWDYGRVDHGKQDVVGH